MSSVLVPRRSQTWSRKVKISRHVFQTAMVLWVAWLVWEKSQSSTVASPEAFCPFGGFETAWTFITTGKTVSHVHTSNLVLVGVVVILAVSARGFFCGWLCPLGAIQGLIGKASPVAIQRNAANCLGCTICNDACPMNLPVNTRTRVTDGGCIGCLECVVACPRKDALALTFSFPTHIPIVSSEDNCEEIERLNQSMGQNKEGAAS